MRCCCSPQACSGPTENHSRVPTLWRGGIDKDEVETGSPAPPTSPSGGAWPVAGHKAGSVLPVKTVPLSPQKHKKRIVQAWHREAGRHRDDHTHSVSQPRLPPGFLRGVDELAPGELPLRASQRAQSSPRRLHLQMRVAGLGGCEGRERWTRQCRPSDHWQWKGRVSSRLKHTCGTWVLRGRSCSHHLSWWPLFQLIP